MADPSDSSLAFFTKATSEQWSFVLKLYSEVLRLKAQATRDGKKGGPEELIKLDTWFQEKLPKTIHMRKEPHLLHDELVQVMKWKLMRGKFRPRLLDLVRINTESSVLQTTKKAFKKMSHGNNLSQAVTALTNLKGIGPATASAVLVAAYPELVPFMADETMLSTPGVEATDYTLAEYMNYAEQIISRSDRLKAADPEGKWTPHKVEMALWTHYLARELKPSLLENMPKNGQTQDNNDNDNDNDNDKSDIPSTTTNNSTENIIDNIDNIKQDDNSNSNEAEDKITSTTTSSPNQIEAPTNGNSNNKTQQEFEQDSASNLSLLSNDDNVSNEKSNDSSSLIQNDLSSLQNNDSLQNYPDENGNSNPIQIQRSNGNLTPDDLTASSSISKDFIVSAESSDNSLIKSNSNTTATTTTTNNHSIVDGIGIDHHHHNLVDTNSNDNAVDGVNEPAFKRQRLDNLDNNLTSITSVNQYDVGNYDQLPIDQHPVDFDVVANQIEKSKQLNQESSEEHVLAQL